jgi:hypothetical protein
MDEIDYDDPEIEEDWCFARRDEVLGYLDRQGVKHREVGEWPAWFVAPYVSVWAIESLKCPGSVGWWAICGDLPTDYISSKDLSNPREVVNAFADVWQELSSYMERGEPHPSTIIGSPEDWPKLAPLLRTRANILHEWAEDDTMWEYED